MAGVALVLVLTGMIPLATAWRANRGSSLRHALAWGGAAWAGWAVALATTALQAEGESPAACYLALCLTGCAAVAVLGARRPGVGPWHFVVLGLLVVLLLPLAEGALPGKGFQLGTVRAVFLAGALAVGVVNYLPTRLGGAAALVGLACAVALGVVMGPTDGLRCLPLAGLLLAAAPWGAWAMSRPTRDLAGVDGIWLGFRDRFGLAWGLRVREQFNRAAANAGWPVELGWGGLHATGGAPPDPATRAAMTAALRGLTQRFGQVGKCASALPSA
jgi:hypothetical protein